jgi:multiple sugar transport system permease protein
MTASTAILHDPARRRHRRRVIGGLRALRFHGSMGFVALLWVAPVLFVLALSIRTFDDIAANGIAALPSTFTLETYADAWRAGGLGRGLRNSLIVTIPTVILSLFIASLAAFGLSRYRVPFRRLILLIMLGGNLLPVQMLLIPIRQFSEQIGIFDTLGVLIVVQTAFGIGFYTFVLYGFMRSIPTELQDAASLDGAGPLRFFFQIILPLTRPALAALGALAFTWNFNDLLWSITLLQSEELLPMTAAVNSLKGIYVSSWSVIAAGTVIAAIPCIIVFIVFQRSFVGGLALGAVK